MTDKELLELAAKAAGINHVKYTNDYDGSCGLMMVGDNGIHTTLWSPLADNGDSFRLAVMLHMFDGGLFERFVILRLEETRLNPNRSDYEITRRAIVRAAAKVGNGMK